MNQIPAPLIDLRDSSKTDAINSAGYAICPFLSPDQIAELHELHRETSAGIHLDYHVTAFFDDPDLRINIRNRISAIVASSLSDLAPGYQLFNASFVTKKARSTNGRLDLHQDYTMVDATSHRGINVWVPLCNVDNRNGCLKLVAGSHRLRHISANPPNPSPYDNVRRLLDLRYMVEQPMQAGHACMFDTGVLHETEENETDSDRISIFLNLIPSGTTAKLYQWQPSNPHQLEFYEISLEVISRMTPNTYMHEAAKHGAQLLDVIHYRFDTLDAADLERILPLPVAR